MGRIRCTTEDTRDLAEPNLGNPAIPRVILIGLKFEVKTLVKKGPNYPVSNPWND